jgi:CspA family cold shock protein
LGAAFTAGVRYGRVPVFPQSNRRSIRQRSFVGGLLLMEFLLMATGTVKWFNAQKGYGFIQPTTGGADVFVHISAVERAGMDGLNEGQKVNYDLEQGQRGRVSAVNLQLA